MQNLELSTVAERRIRKGHVTRLMIPLKNGMLSVKNAEKGTDGLGGSRLKAGFKKLLKCGIVLYLTKHVISANN